MEVRPVPGGVAFRVRVQPRASRDEVVGPDGPALKVRVAVPPVEGRANEACLALLAERLGVPVSRLSVVSGHRAREKVIRAEGVDEQAVRRAFGV